MTDKHNPSEATPSASQPVTLDQDILQEALSLCELLLKEWMETERARQQLAAKMSGSESMLGLWDRRGCLVLVVDDDPKTGQNLKEAFHQNSDFLIISALNSGEALDYGLQQPFHMALVKETLPDLPGTMVAKNLRKQATDSAVLLYSPPGAKPGRLILSDDKETMVIIEALTNIAQLVGAIIGLREAFVTKFKEKRFLTTFRKEHLATLKRYAALRQKLLTFVPDGSK